MAEFGPSDGYATPAFEDDPPRRGTTRVFYGNQQGATRDDPLVHQLVERVADLLARVDSLEERIQALEGDMQDGPDEFDDQPPI